MTIYHSKDKTYLTAKGTLHEGVYCGQLAHPMLQELARFKDGDLTLQDIFTQVLLYSKGESELDGNFK